MIRVVPVHDPDYEGLMHPACFAIVFPSAPTPTPYRRAGFETDGARPNCTWCKEPIMPGDDDD